MVIYKITNIINKKIYIGIDTKNRPNYYGSGIAIKRAIKKYGKNSFNKEIIEKCDNIDQLNEREIYWISIYNSCDQKIGYNIAKGGKNVMLNRKHSKKSKKKMSIAKKGLDNGWKNRKHSEESKKKMSLSQKKFFKTINGLKRIQEMVKTNKKTKGKYKRSDDFKNKLSKIKKEYYKNQKNIEKLKNSRKNFENSLKGKKHHKKLGVLNRNRMLIQKIILKIKNGIILKEYKNTNEIKKEYPTFSSSNILKCVRGNRNFAYGFQWKWK